VGSQVLRRLDGGAYFLFLAIVFLVVLGAFGGASRGDEIQQTVVRAAAIGAIAAALWPLDLAAFPNARGAVAGIALVYILLLAQLLPLPPDLWARMPGHDIYRPVAEQTHSVGWRPWTLSPDLTMNSVAALLPATAIGLLTLALDFRGRLVLAQWIVGVACVSAVLGLLQLGSGGASLHLFRTSSENSAVGLFANRNHQAALMACSLPIVAAILSIRLRDDEGLGRLYGLAGITVLLLMALAATGSRMGLLLGLVGAVSALTIYAVTVHPSAKVAGRRFWLAGAAASIAGLAPISILLMRSGAVTRLASDPIDQTRVAALQPMLATVQAFFPFGAGFGTFDPVYRHFEPDSLLSTIYLNQAHNEPVQLAIEGGLPALLLLLLFLGWWVRAAVRSVRPRESISRRALGMAMTATCLTLMLSSLVDYPLRTPLLSGLFTIACVELVRSKRPPSVPHAS